MNQKLIFLDVDGTLLPAGDMLPPESAMKAIRAAQKNGHKVFLCTGRNYRMTQPLLEQGFDGFVCSAGGYVGYGDRILVDLPMTAEQVEGLCTALNAGGVDCTLEARDKTFGGRRLGERFARIFQADDVPLNSEAERWRKAMRDGMELRPLSEYAGEPIYKIVFIASSEEELTKARSLYEKDFVFCEYGTSDLEQGFVNGELINRCFNKGTGIKAVCEALCVPLKDTIGFGDSENDAPMTDVVGISVCMGNGSDRLKACCDRVCPAVTEDGIAREFAALGLI